MSGENLVEHRLGQLEGAIKDIREALTGINASLVTLTRLEVRHAETRDAMTRAHQRIDDIEDKLDEIMQALPVLKLTSNWVKAGVICAAALLLGAVAKLVLGGA